MSGGAVCALDRTGGCRLSPPEDQQIGINVLIQGIRRDASTPSPDEISGRHRWSTSDRNARDESPPFDSQSGSLIECLHDATTPQQGVNKRRATRTIGLSPVQDAGAQQDSGPIVRSMRWHRSDVARPARMSFLECVPYAPRPRASR
jgi:hypothetical protein